MVLQSLIQILKSKRKGRTSMSSSGLTREADQERRRRSVSCPSESTDMRRNTLAARDSRSPPRSKIYNQSFCNKLAQDGVNMQ